MDSVHPISSRLKQAREARSLSITELSKLTSIRIHIIQALDEGRLDELPSVYMRSFIKRYAQAVGITSDEIDELMEQHLGAPASSSSTASSVLNAAKSMRAPIMVGPNAKRKRTLAILYILLGLCGVGLLYFMYSPQHPATPPKSTLSPSMVISSQDSASASSKGTLMNYFGLSSVDSVALEAVATDTVWLTITIDGKSTEQLTLFPTQTKRWVAADKFLMSVGNAGGIHLKRNGQDLPALGKTGETVRSIRITKSEFLTSASPWKSQRDTTRKSVPPKAAPKAAPPSSSSSQKNIPSASVKSQSQPAKQGTSTPVGVSTVKSGSGAKPLGTKSPTGTAKSASSSVLTAQQKKERAEKLKRLERIRQAQKNTGITPVKIP